MTRVLQMLEASRRVTRSRFADTIEYAIFEEVLRRLHAVIDTVAVYQTNTLSVECLDQRGKGKNR